MALKQLTVFVENKQGSLATVADLLAKNGIDMRALSLADTKDFGILRLIVNDTDKALTVLRDSGILVQATEVTGVKLSDKPGQLSVALAALGKANINVEYLYAFLARTQNHAYVVFRVADNAAAEAALVAVGFHLVTEADVKKL